MTISTESTFDVRIAQRELRELADRLNSAANVAGDACVLSGTAKDRDRSEHNMHLAVARAEGVLHDLNAWMERCKKVPRRST